MKIAEIARLANVSKAAVSLALNNKPGISEQTRERVLKIVRDSGYIHRSLVNAEQIYNSTKSIRFLACIHSDVVSPQYHMAPFFTELINGLEKQCRAKGYALIFSSVKIETLAEEIEVLEKEHISGGIILLGTNLTAEEVDVVARFQPNLVILDALLELLNVNSIVMNNIMGAYTAASYLLNLGHRHIGYVQSKNRISNFESRKRGFETALKEKGLEVNSKDLFTVGDTIENAQKEFREIIASVNSLPTALFCENDYIAVGIIKALQEMSINVPEQVSVIGFDNIPQATIITPELTTIHVEKEKMGALAVKRLIEIIEKKDLAKIKIMIDTQLVERRSCREYQN
jgi:DNA-binding LacI/PurR family transcriptional regulator